MRIDNPSVPRSITSLSNGLRLALSNGPKNRTEQNINYLWISSTYRTVVVMVIVMDLDLDLDLDHPYERTQDYGTYVLF